MLQSAPTYDVLLHNCRVATLCANGSKFGALLGGAPDCMVGVRAGRIAFVGAADAAVILAATEAAAAAEAEAILISSSAASGAAVILDATEAAAAAATGAAAAEAEAIFSNGFLNHSSSAAAGAAATTVVHDLAGRWVTPALIDCHTHIVYGGDRCGEWELKLGGASYEEVAQAGGGIVNTVDGTRAASVEELVDGARPRVEALLREGVTTLEVKSGYGLDEATERRQLQAGKRLGEAYGITVVTTFLGAHAVPREFRGRADEYIDTVVLPSLDALAAEGLVDAVDAFSETVGFSIAQTKRVFDRAAALGIPVRLHGDQLHDFGGASLAAQYNALSCDHCEHTSEAGVAAMAAAGTVAVLLPTSNYFIREAKKPPVAQFRAAGVPMALATNCNPGSSPCSSLLLCMNMGCTLMGMTPEEALLGVTRHAAAAIGQTSERGTIEVGKVADLAVWKVKSLVELSYYMGLNQIDRVYSGGKLRA